MGLLLVRGEASIRDIEIENECPRPITARCGGRTKTEAVELARRHLASQPMTREEALEMRGTHAIHELPADSGPPEAI